MEEYIVSARKYRPSAFDTVIGQEALTTTLKNAIAEGKLAHAYLFCGPRGVGKTTCARIFAKTINCLNPKENGEACDTCESCMAFNEQRSLNIYELDAASNNSVEEIRALIEKVRIPPQIGKYKVFIIDEVHMLSTAAFNAFLKTLEEPPSYVIFILATTEKHKILPTILSRCQVYDFNRMNVPAIVRHLQYVADREGYSVEEEALNVIAQKADGGMRDALSIFDQAISYSNGNLTYRKVIENLNVLDYDHYFNLVDHCLKNEVSQSLLLFNTILRKGFDGAHFISGLASHLRDVLVSQDEVTLPLLEVSEDIRKRYQDQAKRCTASFLYRAIKLCSDCDIHYRSSKNKQLLVEITLIQLAQLTLEDDSSGSGRCPEKMLKPLFKPAATQSVAVNASPSQTTMQKASPVAAPSTGHTSNVTTAPCDTSERKIPKIKMGQFGPSIRKKELETTVETPKAVAIPEETTQKEECKITEEALQFFWHEFANMLPKEETAMAQRMRIMRPKLLQEHVFEVMVENNQVEEYLLKMAPRIVTHLKAGLKNSQVTMKIRVATANEVVKVYSKPQQLQVMLKKSKPFAKLKEALQLELA